MAPKSKWAEEEKINPVKNSLYTNDIILFLHLSILRYDFQVALDE
jgi:hypothetical protein